MTTEALYQGTFRKNNWVEKLAQNKWFWPLFVLVAFSYPIYRSVNRQLPPPLPVIFELPHYQLTNQFSEPFGDQNLKGKPYLANFIFTSCTTSCVKVMEQMKVIQKRMKGVGTAAAIVTFTVDPENDTPGKLLKFAQENHANPYVWSFLTGSNGSMKAIVVDGFKLVMGEKESVGADMMDIAHSEKIALVDGRGRVRGYYSLDKISVDKLMIDLGLLINTEKENKV